MRLSRALAVAGLIRRGLTALELEALLEEDDPARGGGPYLDRALDRHAPRPR